MKIFENIIVRIIFAIFEWILCGILVLLILLTGFQKFSNQGNFFGYRIYTIASGSMIPRYNIGDTLLIEEMPSSEINVGDAVTYIAEKGGKDGMIITHEVMKVNVDENGKYSFNTKGVANNIEDPIVYEDQVLGKVIHKFFFLSILGRITTNMVLTLLFVIIPIAFIAAIELFKAIQRDVDEEDEEDDDDEEEIEEEEETSEEKETEPEEEKDLDLDDDGEDDFEEEDFDEDESEEEIEEEPEEDESDKEIVNKNKK
jgi:signal peptidase I